MPRIRLGGEARVRRDPAERGFAQQLLSWEPDGLKLRAETSRCRYFIFEGRYETAAWCEPRELGAWRLRIEIGLFTSPEFAMRACEADAQRRLQRRMEVSAVRRRLCGNVLRCGVGESSACCLDDAVIRLRPAHPLEVRIAVAGHGIGSRRRTVWEHDLVAFAVERQINDLGHAAHLPSIEGCGTVLHVAVCPQEGCVPMKTEPLTIRIDKKLKAEAKKAAKDDARSLTNLIVKLLTDYLKEQRS